MFNGDEPFAHPDLELLEMQVVKRRRQRVLAVIAVVVVVALVALTVLANVIRVRAPAPPPTTVPVFNAWSPGQIR